MPADDHGSESTYVNHRCRCDQCRAAVAAGSIVRRKARAARLAVDPSLAPHGSTGTYRNWGCRCRSCRDAQAAVGRAYRRRNRGS